MTRKPEDLEVGLAAAEGHGGPGERMEAEITGSNTALRIKIRLTLLYCTKPTQANYLSLV